MRYMFLTMPLSKATKDKGLLGDPEKQDLKRKSYSLAKVLSKNNMSSSKRESSMGSLGSMSHAPAKFSPIRSES